MAAAGSPGDRARRCGRGAVEEGGLAAGKGAAAARGAWTVFEDEAGRSLTPPRARTWGRVGRTPVLRVRGRGSGRIHVYRGRKDERRGFTWTDYRDLIIRAHLQLAGPIVLVWDNLRTHLMPQMQEFIAANQHWLTVFQLPTYAPDLNPQEMSLPQCEVRRSSFSWLSG